MRSESNPGCYKLETKESSSAERTPKCLKLDGLIKPEPQIIAHGSGWKAVKIHAFLLGGAIIAAARHASHKRCSKTGPGEAGMGQLATCWHSEFGCGRTQLGRELICLLVVGTLKLIRERIM
ncbi:hypothetical protein CDAR_512561 [Caerostris darwini]|uniref:Uncharacterized protein n=1 Tax=Caerostris darwini TaxID=1538125 RepID=A0AAV4SVV8_9ARAC|nr:hypothetical protein CDAR_512561 [Caerostris darwini]